VKAVIKKRDGATIIILCGTVFFITIVNDILFVNGIVFTGFFVPFGFFVFIFSQAFLLAHRFVRSFFEIETLAVENNRISLELQELNRELEKRIEKRTAELEAKNRLLADLAVKDGLTGLFNHKHTYERLNNLIVHSGRYKRTLTVAMYDIDHFKSINDNYGHQTGDLVLASVAETLKRASRAVDIIGRYGGEEFLIVMPETSIDGAFVFAERIRKSIENLKFKDGKLKVTISGGVAEYTGEGATELVEKADNLLYEAKESGRNRIIKSSETGGIEEKCG